MAIPLLDGCALAGKVVTADALLTQRALAEYLIGRQAHYSFTVKGNQPSLERDIALLFATRGAPDFVEVSPADHGRIETRRIWCSATLNAYLDFPHVGQVFLIEREAIEKKTGKHSRETALGITSQTAHEASPQQVLATVPEDYLLGNKAMYLFAFNNVKPAFSKDGLFSEAGAKTTLKAIASFNPEVRPEKIDTAQTYTNEFVNKALAKFAQKR